MERRCWQCEKPVRRTMTPAGASVWQCTDLDCGWMGENPMQVDEKGKAVRKGEDRDLEVK